MQSLIHSKHRSTVYREINRNKEYDQYLAGIDHQKALSKASNGRIGKLQQDGYLRNYVV